MIIADVHGDFLVLRFVATKPEQRENKAVYVLSDAEMGDMDLLFAAVARISRGGPTPLPPEGGVPAGERNAAFRRQRLQPHT